jgi:hypothetical protein
MLKSEVSGRYSMFGPVNSEDTEWLGIGPELIKFYGLINFLKRYIYKIDPIKDNPGEGGEEGAERRRRGGRKFKKALGQRGDGAGAGHGTDPQSHWGE